MVSLILFAFCILLLWVTHRIHDAYVHVVAREELQARRRKRRHDLEVETDLRTHHLGPKVFLLLDFTAVLAIIWSLKRLGFYFANEGIDTLMAVLLTCVHFSIVIALWMLLEALHLQSYYQRLARAASALKGEAARLAWKGPRNGPIKRGTIWLAVLWSGVPILLELAGLRILSAADTPRSAVLLFAGGFLVPQVILMVLLARNLLPLRRIAYANL